MKSIKGWVTHDFNDMRLEEVPYPQLMPGWAIVKTKVVQPSVTEVQLFYGERSNSYDKVKKKLSQGPQQLFGHEFCGEIVEVDEKNEFGLGAGDRVGATHTHIGTIGRDFPGCFSEYAAIPLDALAKMPGGVTDWEVAAIQPLTSCIFDVRSLGVTLGDVVLILGQGVMGLNCTQVAKAAGADTVIGVDRRDDILTLAHELGADVTINAAKENVVDRVMDLTHGKGVPFVIEAASGSPRMGLSGGSTVSDAVACVAAGGKILSIPHFHEPVTLDFNYLRAKKITYMFPPELATPKQMVLAARLIAQKRIKIDPMITHKLEGIDKVLQSVEITANKAKYGALNPAQVRF
ncbi:MAG TPA: zinc-binding dehydrogenase [Candidatus Binatia bacterium]|nr:zinc-binding dehydrogenase [Candidatus Binatia bacterium]